MKQEHEIDSKARFEYQLKGKKYGGELHNWAIRDVITKDGELLGQIAYGYINGFRNWRTSKVVKVTEVDGVRIVETHNSYYVLHGPEADENIKQALYNALYG